MFKMWVKLLEKYLPEAELIYTADECGCGLHATNDPCLRNHYVIDCWGVDGLEPDWGASEDTTREILQKLLETEEKDVQKLIGMLADSEYNNQMFVYKWEFENDLSAWD